MTKNPHQIRREIAALERKLKEAEKEQQRKSERAIVRAAKRTGLLKVNLSAAELESAFRRIVSSTDIAIGGATASHDAERRIGTSKIVEEVSDAG